jgi:hypothetical protein
VGIDLSGITTTTKEKTVRETASKILFGFAELGRSHKEKSTSVDERSEEFDESKESFEAEKLLSPSSVAATQKRAPRFSREAVSRRFCVVACTPAAFLCYFL